MFIENDFEKYNKLSELIAAAFASLKLTDEAP
jgi:hypothetical protein